MPRIIDVDTEAFAPTYQKAYKEREPRGDVQTRRMMADLQLVGQAMPYVSEGIKGIDQYVVTPIQQAMKEGREEEYKAKKAGEMPFEISETTMQKLARERQAAKQGLEDRENLEKGLGIPEFGESMKARVQPLSLQAQQLEGMSETERAAQWLKEARAETEQAEEPQAYEWTPPVTRGKMVGTDYEVQRYKSKGRVATPEYDASGRRITKPGQAFKVAPEMTAAIKVGRREDEDQEADRLAQEFEATREAGLPRGATGIGEYDLSELQQQQIAAQRVRESMGKSSRAEQGLRARPAEVDEAIIKALAAEPEEARTFKEPQVTQIAGVTMPTTEEPAPTRMMPEHPVPTGYQWPARGRYTAPGAPTEGFAGAEAPAEPTQTAQMAKTATTTARAGARTAAEPVAPTEPAKPKTLATVTDDELSDVKRRLEKMVEQNPEDKELANRLEMVNLEQRHRGEKIEFEDWAPMARAADTVEEQRKVLELAKRVRMPVEGFESLLTSPFERAKLKALGAKGEKGLFPEVARPLTSWEIDKKQTEIRINQLKAQGLSDKQAADQALAEKRRAEAGRARAQTTEIETMLEPKYAAAAEKPFLMHAQEEKAKAETQKILELLPGQKQKLADESAKLKALAAKARGSIRRGGAGLNSDELKWVKEINDRRNEMVNQATKVEMEAEAQYGRLEVAAERAKLMAERAALDANKLGPEGLDEAENRKIRQAQAEASAAKTAYEQAEADRRVANKARIDAQANKREALRAGDVDKADADYLTELAMKKRGITLPSAQKRAGAAPVAPAAKEEGGIMGAVRGMFGGGAKPAAAPVKKGSKIDDFFGK